MIVPLFELCRAALFYATLAGFGVVAGIFNVGCAVFSWRRGSPVCERFVQYLLHRFFRLLRTWTRAIHAVSCEFRGFERLNCDTPTVIVANHPGLMDFTLLLSELPSAICLFKPAIRRNPLLGPAATLAGYVVSNRGLHTVLRAANKVTSGTPLIIFPEGTRTMPGGQLQPLHAGFALIASRAGARICVVTIRTDSNLFAKGRSWWKLPTLPARLVFDVTLELPPHPARRPAELVRLLENHWQTTLAVPLTEPVPLAPIPELSREPVLALT